MKTVCNIINQLRETSSRKKKEEILLMNKDNNLLRKVLFYTYDSDMRFKSIKELPQVNRYRINDYGMIFNYLDKLSKQNGVKDEEKQYIWDLIHSIEDEEIKDIFKCIIQKDLKCGISTKTINKIFGKGFVKEFNIMLARPESDLDKFIKKYDECYVNPKYDGVRCIIEVRDGNITLLSRSGEEYDVEPLKQIIKENLKVLNCVLDGEITYGNNDLQTLMTLMRRKEYINEHYKLFENVNINIFDCLEFNRVIIEDKLLSERIEFIPKSINNNEYIKYVPYKKIKVEENIIKEELNKMVDKGYEGIVLKADAPYIRKKTIEWLKVKKKDNMDVKVIDVEEGKGKYKNMLGAFICETDEGKIFKVGSGLTVEDRIYFWNDKNDIIDKYIEIEYQELTKDGKPRNPVFIRLREDKI